MAESPHKQEFQNTIHQQYNYLLGFQASRKINNLGLEKRWPQNNTGAKDDPYKTPTLVHNWEMDQLVVANTFNNEME
jgi:hypothetical protein